MSARGSAARRRRWGEKDNDAKQLEAMLDSWLLALPDYLAAMLEMGLRGIFGNRIGKESLNSTQAERDKVIRLIERVRQLQSQPDDEPGQPVVDSSPGQKENSMSIEKALADLTAAVEANTAALKAAGKGGAASGGSTSAGTTASKAPKKTREELAAILGKVKDASDAATAKGLIKTVGKSDKLADVADENVDALYKAAEEKLAEEPM